MNPTLQKMVDRAELIMRTIVLIALVAGWVSLMTYEERLDRASPTAPDAATGEVVPVHVKSGILYMRPFDAEVVSYIGYGTVVAVVGVLALALLRKQRRNSNRPTLKP